MDMFNDMNLVGRNFSKLLTKRLAHSDDVSVRQNNKQHFQKKEINLAILNSEQMKSESTNCEPIDTISRPFKLVVTKPDLNIPIANHSPPSAPFKFGCLSNIPKTVSNVQLVKPKVYRPTPFIGKNAHS